MFVKKNIKPRLWQWELDFNIFPTSLGVVLLILERSTLQETVDSFLSSVKDLREEEH